MNTITNRIQRYLLIAFSAVFSLCIAWPAYSQTGTVVVEAVTEPPTAGTVGFTGIPSGQITLPQGALPASGLSPGSYVSSLSYIDPALLTAGYKLTSIDCSDSASATPSIGDVANGSATFNLDNAETVHCIFQFTTSDQNNPGDDGGDGGGDDDGSGDDDGGGSDDDGTIASNCICPQQGAWRVSNLPGQMVCTGVMSMTMPLAASNDTGFIEASNACRTLTASGLSDDEATITFNRTAECGYKGSVGGSHEGIPMVIDFTLNLENKRKMTGSLHSVVNQSGMTCTMSRDYTMSASN